MVVGKQKRHLRAWWLLPSFSRNQFPDIDFVLYMGAHKPRQEGTKHMEEVKNDPDAYLPKIDISVYTMYNQGESFPIYAREAAPLIAGINLLNTLDNGQKTITDKSLFLLKMWEEGRNDLPSKPYTEFDPNRMTFKKVIDIATKYGPPMVRYDLVDPLKRQKHIMWLKGAHVVMKRPLRDKRNTFVKDMLLIGKDMLRNEIVLGMKKSIGNYSRIVPLHKKGLYFLTSIRFMIENRPSKFPIITATTLERLVQEKMHEMKNIEMGYCEITNKTGVLIERLGMEL